MKVLIEATVSTPFPGEGTAILPGHLLNAKVSQFVEQRMSIGPGPDSTPRYSIGALDGSVVSLTPPFNN